MAKDKKKVSKRSGPATTKSASMKKTPAKKTTKKGTGRAAATAGAGHHAAFRTLAARSNRHNMAPVCYQQLASGEWMICFLQSDGSYAQCQAYSGPIHQPPCG